MRLVFVLTLQTLVWSAETTKTPITITDLLKIRRVTEVRISPDGTFAVFTVQSIHEELAEKDKSERNYSYRTHIWQIDLNDSAAKPRQLTFGDRRDSGLSISPDGERLAFVREDQKKIPQVWVMPLNRPGEAAPVTQLEHGATNPVWHPRANRILVASTVPFRKITGKPHYDMERPNRDWFDYDRQDHAQLKQSKIEARPDGDRRALRNWLEQNAARGNPTVIHRLAFQDEQSLLKEPTATHFFLIDLASGNKATAITSDFYRRANPCFSPDGARIVYESTPPGTTHPDRERRSSIWIMNEDGSQMRPLLDQEGESFTQPKFYPQGDALLVEAQQMDEPAYRQSRLLRYDLNSKKLEWISQGWSSSIGQSLVAENGSILFTSNWRGSIPLNRVQNGKRESLVEGPVGVGAFDQARGRIVFSQVQPSNPNELWLRDRNGELRLLTALNTDWLANKLLSRPVERWIERPGGLQVQSWEMNPVNAQPGKKYPWVLEMHGGPSAMWGPGEFTMWFEFQLLCAWGYGVTYSNPRGSSGYGYEFQKANYRDWGPGPASDVLAALDASIRENPLVDAGRLFLTGGSYAGYLTAWIVAHDHRFRAAAAQRGVYDLRTFYGEGNAFRLVKYHFGGYPYEPEIQRILEEQSPFTHVARIRTPLLILHGSEDLRTGVSQSEMLYRALKQQGKAVEYVRYPGAGHELTRSGSPLQRMDHMLRIIEFFERYANNDAPAPTSPQ
ncbi:MAG: S9 family peptidase [Bryobacteraceae bacterium]|nr:S9 family peptidase [Bryobacteraceae bacterium]MDW8377642.1 S9 family peptidase [Bryobacterales bacterium]